MVSSWELNPLFMSLCISEVNPKQVTGCYPMWAAELGKAVADHSPASRGRPNNCERNNNICSRTFCKSQVQPFGSISPNWHFPFSNPTSLPCPQGEVLAARERVVCITEDPFGKTIHSPCAQCKDFSNKNRGWASDHWWLLPSLPLLLWCKCN